MAIPAIQIQRGTYTAKKLMNALGLKDFQACGLVGCFLGESHCNPAEINKSEKAGTFKGSAANGAGYGAGIAQWSNTWKSLIQKQFNRYSPIETWSLDQQIEVVIYHLKNTHKKLYAALQTASSVAQATDYALRGYENSGKDQGFMRSKTSMSAYTWAKNIDIPNLGRKHFSDGYTGLITNRTAYANIIVEALGGTNIADLSALGSMIGADMGGGIGIDTEALKAAAWLGGYLSGMQSMAYPVHSDYITFNETYSDLFSQTNSTYNTLQISQFSKEANKNIEMKIHEGRIYSVNDATIVLDELSLPTDYKNDEYISKDVKDSERKQKQSNYDHINSASDLPGTIQKTEEKPNENTQQDDKKKTDQK